MTLINHTLILCLILESTFFVRSQILTDQSELPAGVFHDQGDTKWIVIKGQLRGYNDTVFGRPPPGRPIGRPGLAALRAYLMFLVTVN